MPFDIGTRGLVVAKSVDHNDVQRTIELAITTTVQAVTNGHAGGGRDW
ncbi:MAG: hypothetical protein JWM55_720 [Acidimicrobiaceae bacterium]|nr:hypothetical protein [Acidimicrobiaceae bacterium]